MKNPASHQAEFTWQYIFSIALQHKKQLLTGHVLALVATALSVPVPLLMPLLVDEVLLNHPGHALNFLDSLLRPEWRQPVVYITAILIASLLLRLLAMIFNIIQTRQFSQISKDVIFNIRKNLLHHLQHISMAEYENLGSGTVTAYLVTDLDTLDNFIGSTINRLLVACLTVLGTALILLWMHWQLGLFIILLNPVVIYFTRVIGLKIKLTACFNKR